MTDNSMNGDNVAILARMLIERHDIATRGAAAIRVEQKARGYGHDSSADRLEGSAAAYSVACSIIAGLMGEPSIDTVAAGGMARQSAPPIDIAATVDLDADSGRGSVVDLADGDHFAGMPDMLNDRDGVPS